MKNLKLTTLCLIATTTSYAQNTMGYYGKRNNVELNVGTRFDLAKSVAFNTGITASLNYGLTLRRLISADAAIGIGITSTAQNVDNNIIMYVPEKLDPLDDFNSNFPITAEGALSAKYRITRVAIFKETSSKNSALPLGLSAEWGLGAFYAKMSEFRFALNPIYYNSYSQIPSKLVYTEADLGEQDLSALGVYVHWRVNLKFALSRNILLNFSWLTNIPLFSNRTLGTEFLGPNVNSQYVSFRTKSFFRYAGVADFATLKIGGVYCF